MPGLQDLTAPLVLIVFIVSLVLFGLTSLFPLRRLRQRYPVLDRLYERRIRFVLGIINASLLAAAMGQSLLLVLEEQKRYSVVTVFYGTDRNTTGDRSPAVFYGDGRGMIQFGLCKVSVPVDHRMGQLESPFIAKIPILRSFRGTFEEPEKHLVLLSLEPKEQAPFIEELRRNIQESARHEAFVFIHGYNVTFEDSCRRTAQIAYDLKFAGAPIMYSWPSEGTVAAYVKDETVIEWSTPNFKRFIVMIAEQTGAMTVHLIAHSMGSRAIARALDSVVSQRGKQSSRLFNQVILAAPDIDAGVFRNLAEAVRTAAERTTVYASSNDGALSLSKRFHGYARAGDAGANLTVIEGIDTIDASTVDTSLLGHSYYAERSSVIADLFELMVSRRPPRERFYLRERKRDGLIYWEFRP